MVTGTPSELVVPIQRDEHILGLPEAPVTLLEYGDYECPDCMASFPIVNRLLAQFGGRLKFVFRHFPLTSVHPRASIAAQTAEAAGAQGKFWPMHNLLYESRGGLDPADLDRMAMRLNLDLYRFQGDLTTGRWVNKVERDAAGGRQSGVTGTPTFFLNGRRAPREYDALHEAIELALKG
jgi:protein-disulfide isomerase